MIESYYWRAELKSDLSWLRKKRKFQRWTEKQQVLYERKLMIVAFQVRSLLERPKVNDLARKTRLPVLRFKKMGVQPFTVTGTGWLEDRFDVEHPQEHSLSAVDVCNQLIHYYWMQTIAANKAFVLMNVFSDYRRHQWAYQIQIEELLEFFAFFSREQSSVTSLDTLWDEKKHDYVVIRSNGPE